jgi:hypothetical protein
MIAMRTPPGAMRVFKTKPFARFADREGVSDGMLCRVARRLASGLVDADLGSGVVKQRIARKGEGSAGGLRSIILFRWGERCLFVYG